MGVICARQLLPNHLDGKRIFVRYIVGSAEGNTLALAVIGGKAGVAVVVVTETG